MARSHVRWGIVGCGDVTEVKSGPALQQADGSSLVAVMRRDRRKAEDYAHRHGVPRAYDDADALIGDPEVDAVYIATPPSSHCELALRVANRGKPCLVEKPMAATYADCRRMVEAFAAAHLPLWVAYYRRALPRFLFIRDHIAGGAIGAPTSFTIDFSDRVSSGPAATAWRVDPEVAGGGLFFDLASHALDLIDFALGPITDVAGFAVNTAGMYRAEDVTAAAFRVGGTTLGTGLWNCNSDRRTDRLTIVGTRGRVACPIFADGDVACESLDTSLVVPFRNPPHVHQPFIQTVVDEMRGLGPCASTGTSAARASWVLEQCVAGYYGPVWPAQESRDQPR